MKDKFINREYITTYVIAQIWHFHFLNTKNIKLPALSNKYCEAVAVPVIITLTKKAVRAFQIQNY
jgi:hypothetical protein